MKRLKNTKESSDTWVSQTIEPNTYYEVQFSELFRWQNDSKVLTDIGSGDLLVNDGTTDISDVAQAINFLKDEDTVPRDSDGSPMQRVKVTTSGWAYQLHGMEITISKLDSLVSKKDDGTDFGFLTIKCYDSNGDELVTQESCDTQAVKTVVDWEPNHDYEIVGGMFRQTAPPAQDVRLWVVGVPDVPAQYGGSKLFAANVNAKFLGESLRIDGRAPKYMTYSATYHTNKLRMVFKHPEGFQHTFHVVFELFKA